MRFLHKFTATLWSNFPPNFKYNFLNTLMHWFENKLLFRLLNNLTSYDQISIPKLLLGVSTKNSLQEKWNGIFFLLNLINKDFIYQSDWFKREGVIEIFKIKIILWKHKW